MDSYKEFIKEVHALDVRTIELQAQKIIVDGVTYTEILPLWELDPIKYKPEDRKRLNEKGIFFVQCWDLSHYYDVPNQNIWESGYHQRLKGMQQAAIVDITNKHHAEVLLKEVNQWLIRFKAFDKSWSIEKMHNYYGRDFYKSTLYYQDDLKIKFLTYFHTTGVAEKKEGYSPSFLYMLHDIYNVKMAPLEGLKTQLTAITGTELKRGSAKFIFDDERGWVTSHFNNESGGFLTTWVDVVNYFAIPVQPDKGYIWRDKNGKETTDKNKCVEKEEILIPRTRWATKSDFMTIYERERAKMKDSTEKFFLERQIKKLSHWRLIVKDREDKYNVEDKSENEKNRTPLIDDFTEWLQSNTNRITANKNILPKSFELINKKDEIQVARLHKALKSKKLINASLPQFKSLFGLADFTKPIVWISDSATNTELLYFYYKLKESGKLKKCTKQYIVLNHFFIKQDGEKIGRNLKQLFSKIETNIPQRANKIDNCFRSWFTS